MAGGSPSLPVDSEPSTSTRTSLLSTLLFLSGAAALLDEIVFLRLFGPCFGGDAYAVAAVIGAFFSGTALGALVFARMAERSARPLRLYGVLEIGVGLGAIAMPVALDLVEPLLARWVLSSGPLEALGFPRFVVAFVLILVPSALIGGSLPCAAQALARSARLASHAGFLYAWNTAGAVAGTLVTAFILLPSLGTRRTLLAGAAASGIAGLLALTVSASTTRRREDAVRSPRPDRPPHRMEDRPSGSAGLALLAYALSGFAALASEVLWTRAFSQFFQNSVYSFAILLAVFLAGIALGSLCFSVLEQTLKRPHLWGAAIQGAIAAWTLLTIAHFARRYQHLVRFGAPAERSFAGIALGEVRFAIAGLAVPALLFGGFFPIALRLGGAAPDRARFVGRLLAANTLAGVLGSLGAGLLLLPQLGLRKALVVSALVNLLTALLLAARAPIRVGARLGAAAAVLAVGVSAWLVVPGELRFWAVDPGEMLVDYREGPDANVAVVRRDDRSLHLRTNLLFSQGGGEGYLIEQRQGLLPALLHPRSERILVLGLGTGNTAGALTRVPGARVDVIEILPGVLELSRHFAEWNYRLHENSSVRIHVGDAVSFVRYSSAVYDVVIGDLFHPGERGAGALFTVDHFQAVRSRLARGGLFCQWLPLHQLSPEEVRTVTRAFLEAFPQATLWIAYPHALDPSAALIAGESPLAVDVDRLAERLVADSMLLEVLRGCGFDQADGVLALSVTGSAALARASESAPLATRDRPLIEFDSPRKEARRATFPESNLAMIERLWSSTSPIEVGDDAESRRRLEAYREATRRLVRGQIYRMQRLRSSRRDEISSLLDLEISEYQQALKGACDYHYLDLVVADLLGTLLMESRYDEVLALGERAVEACPDVFDFRLHLGRAYTKLLDPEAAIRHLGRAAEIAPDSYLAHAYLGINLYRLQRSDAALAELERARALDDSGTLIWKPLGLLYLAGGDREGARRALERARKIDPSDSEVQQALQSLESP